MTTVNVNPDRCTACKGTLADIRALARQAMKREERSQPIEHQIAEIKRKREFMSRCVRCPAELVRR